jgi:hypothetical protein
LAALAPLSLRFQAPGLCPAFLFVRRVHDST